MRLPVSSQTGLQQLPAPTFPQLGGISSFRGGANSPLSCTHFPSICNSHKKLNRRLSLLVLWSLSRLLPVFVFYNLQSKTRENFLNFHSSPTVLVSFYYEKNQKLKIQPNNPLNRELSCRFCFVCILFKNVWPARLLCPRDFPSKTVGVGCPFSDPPMEPRAPALAGGFFYLLLKGMLS